MDEISSTSYLMTSQFTTSSSDFINISNVTGQHFCYKALYWDLPDSNVRLWDLLIMIPNLLFLCYLLFKVKMVITLLMRSNLQVLTVLFVLVFISQSISVLRCIVSMTVHTDVYGLADRIMWLFLRFVLLATELSVVTFGLFFGHLDSHTSIIRVILVTFAISLIYSSIQGFLEFLYKNEVFHNIQDGLHDYTLFGHGGMIFWFTSSFILFLIYSIICILPLTPLKRRYVMPAKKSFYMYCMVLSVLNLVQGIGSVLLFRNVLGGLCVVDVTTYLYFSGFPPLIYFIFLNAFFRSSRSSGIPFSYHHQVDDDDLYLPSQNQVPADNINSMEHGSINADVFSENHQDFNSFDSSMLSFSHNPLCPTLGSYPDLSLSTPHTFSFPQSTKLPAGKENRMKTFPT